MQKKTNIILEKGNKTIDLEVVYNIEGSEKGDEYQPPENESINILSISENGIEVDVPDCVIELIKEQITHEIPDEYTNIDDYED